MNRLTEHINNGTWLDLYNRSQRDLILFFFYNLFLWLERDQADHLWFTNSRFVWSRQGIVLRDMSFRVEPDPPHSETLKLILEVDTVIAKHIVVIAIENGIVECAIHS